MSQHAESLVTAAMRSRDKNHPAHKRQRLEEERAGEQFARFNINSKFFRRHAERPKARAAIDHRHLGQQSPLAVPDDDHLPETASCSVGVQLL